MFSFACLLSLLFSSTLEWLKRFECFVYAYLPNDRLLNNAASICVMFKNDNKYLFSMSSTFYSYFCYSNFLPSAESLSQVHFLKIAITFLSYLL